MLRAHHFLYDDGHLLLVDEVLRGGEVSLAVAVEHRRIDGLDSAAQQLKHEGVVVYTRHHVGGIDTCEGLILRVLEQTG